MAEVLKTENLIQIEGTVERITYCNSANSYTVASVRQGSETVTVVGILPFLNEGDTAVFIGEYTVHPTYGQQFKAVGFDRIIPQNAAAILKYLSSERTGALTYTAVSEKNPWRLSRLILIPSVRRD